MQSLVLTVIGPDQPGVVESIASVVAEHGGSWVESRMAHLAGQFAGILRVTCEEAKRADLEAALGGVAPGFSVVVAEGRETGDGGEVPRRVKITVVGGDRPGIVRQVSAALAGVGVNVEALETSCRHAPHSGELLFEAKAEVTLPEGRGPDALQAPLEAIAGDLMVDVDWADG